MTLGFGSLKNQSLVVQKILKCHGAYSFETEVS